MRKIRDDGRLAVGEPPLPPKRSPGPPPTAEVLKLLTGIKLYAFVYMPCIYECGPITQSLHLTKKAAWYAAYRARYAACVEIREDSLLFGKSKLKSDPEFQHFGIKVLQIEV